MSVVLARFGLGDPVWLDPVTSVVIVLIGLATAGIFQALVFPLAIRLTRWTPTNLDLRMLRSVRWPVNLGIIVLSVYLALTIPLDLTTVEQERVDAAARALGIILGIAVFVGLISNTFDWYLENLATRTRHLVDLRLFPLLRRIAVFVSYGLGALLVLDVLGISITPLIAGLGLGGLAVALAIQPTLANLFAGTYVMTEGVISTGDYIELETGMAGYVVEVGWRSTRIRTWGNNLVVVPNARFAETIITNYQEPVPAVNVYLTCGVSYDSDLEQVEQVSRSAMAEVLESDPNAVREYGSWFAFSAFGDSNVEFWLFLQAKDRISSFSLQSRLIKLLHQRFREVGIVINYPVRTLQFPDGWGPEVFGQQNGEASGPARAPGSRQPQVNLGRGPRGSGPRRDESEGPDIDGVPSGGEGPPGGPDGPDGPG